MSGSATVDIGDNGDDDDSEDGKDDNEYVAIGTHECVGLFLQFYFNSVPTKDEREREEKTRCNLNIMTCEQCLCWDCHKYSRLVCISEQHGNPSSRGMRARASSAHALASDASEVRAVKAHQGISF